LRLVIPDELAVALEAVEIVLHVHPAHEGGDVFEAGVISDPIPDEPVGVTAPEIVVLLDGVLRQLVQRFAG